MLCLRCQHPTHSHHEGRCNVAGEGFVCDCGQPVIVAGEEVIATIEPLDGAA